MRLQPRFSIRTILVVAAILAVAAGVLLHLSRPNVSSHLTAARNSVGKADFVDLSAEGSRKHYCANGELYHVYFWSTNHPAASTRLHGDYMIIVVTLPNSDQFYRIEPFNYARSRAIGDPLEESFYWVGGEVRDPAESDLWRIRNAKSHGDLRTTLKRHSFLQPK